MSAPSVAGRAIEGGEPILLSDDRATRRDSVMLGVAWLLIVLTVQPWVATVRGPAGLATVEESEVGKALLTGAVFLVTLAIAAPRFRVLVPPTYGLYFAYLLIAVSTALFLANGSALLRAGRMAMVIAVPVLLWPWFTGDPEGFLRFHRRAHVLLGVSVLGGVVLGGAAAWEFGIPFGQGGRLQGVLPPLSAVRVGEIGAVVAGLSVIALAFRRISPLSGATLAAAGLGLIALSHTRTAAGGLLVGLVVASLSVARSRQGRRALTLMFLVLLAGAAFSEPIRSWVLREQTPEQFATLTGRWAAWESVVQKEVSTHEALLGHGLGSKTITLDPDTLAQPWLEIQRVRPIDNGWLSVYWESGLVGVVLILLALVTAFAIAWRAPTLSVRAACVFLLVLATVASFLETGLSDTSSLTLHVLVAGGASYGDRLAARSRRARLEAAT